MKELELVFKARTKRGMSGQVQTVVFGNFDDFSATTRYLRRINPWILLRRFSFFLITQINRPKLIRIVSRAEQYVLNCA